MENNINLNFLNNLNVSYLGTSRFNKNSNSYIIFNKKCKSLIHNNKDKLKLIKILQNIKGKNIITLSGLLNTETNIVIKIQSYDNAKKEYDINKLLQVNKLYGFIKFKCFFDCNVNKIIKNRNTYNNISNLELCENIEGNDGIIIMKYHENESLESFLNINIENNKKQIQLLFKIVPVIIENYMNAFNMIGFIHGDFFSKNIVLTKEKNPLIIDFELSKIDGKLIYFWNDIRNFFISLSYKFNNTEFIDNILRQCTLYEATNQNINDIKQNFLNFIIEQFKKYL